jgi:hypothetical protein
LVLGLQGGDLGGVSIEALLAGRPGSLLGFNTGDIGMAVEALYFMLLIDIHLL